ncbi:MAG: PHP domain-containing protein [Armatimonadetes bacterium]|nr:PHP domain-containing protein [Armatimonadota bacterium]
MPSPYDFHIHTAYLKCANETMSVPALVRRCEGLGLEAIAITDHLNAPEFLPQHSLIRQDLNEIATSMRIYFGVEVNVIDKDTGAVSIDEAQRAEGGFEMVIGGPHSSYFDKPDKEAIIDLQHRLMLQVLANPLVDVLVHPWWFGTAEFRPGGPMEWLTDMGQIPDWHVRELSEAALRYGKAIEANHSAFFIGNQYGPTFRETYPHYLAEIAGYGVRISIATDAHDISRLDGIHPMMDILESVGITREQLWTPEMLLPAPSA